MSQKSETILKTRLIDVADLAAYVGPSTHTIYTMVSQRRIPFVKDFSVPQAKGDAVVAFLQEKEVRENMAGFDVAQKGLAYVLASERDDTLTMRAVVNAPGQPWVAGEMKEKADSARASRVDPTGYAKHEQAKVLRESMASLREHVCVWGVYLGVAHSTIVAVFGRMDVATDIGAPSAVPRQHGEELRKDLSRTPNHSGGPPWRFGTPKGAAGAKPFDDFDEGGQ